LLGGVNRRRLGRSSVKRPRRHPALHSCACLRTVWHLSSVVWFIGVPSQASSAAWGVPKPVRVNPLLDPGR